MEILQHTPTTHTCMHRLSQESVLYIYAPIVTMFLEGHS